MDFVIVPVLIIGIYILRQDHKVLGKALDKIIEHLGIEEEEKKWELSYYLLYLLVVFLAVTGCGWLQVFGIYYPVPNGGLGYG